MRWKIGNVQVTQVTELETVGHTRFILPRATPEEIKKLPWLAPAFANAEGYLKLSIHALVVDTGKQRILVDTCIGNGKRNRSIPSWNNLDTPFLQRLADAGYPVESIDAVFCTHLHVDHVGWNTKCVDGRWIPTFPRARYVFGRAEFEHWKVHRESPMTAAVMDDSVLPVCEAGLVDFVDNGDALCPEASVFLTPGHSPGHLAVRIRSAGAEAVLAGDVAHHPCQMAHLDWASTADTDVGQSTETRRKLFSELAGRPTLVIGGHYIAGYIDKDGDAFRFKPAVGE
jgi:glyoxylase-like metal-dependent hydrolase (beta-lactamase superfamily II)